MKIQIFNQTKEDIKEVKQLLNRVFKTIEAVHTMQIILVTKEEIQRLNKIYREIDRPTDVLSFVSDDELEGSLGDVFISLEKALEQSETYGHSFEREVAFLAVHGYLHLKGFDHQTSEEEKEMILAQEQILKKAGLERIVYESRN